MDILKVGEVAGDGEAADLSTMAEGGDHGSAGLLLGAAEGLL
jgi:hypothetical protein